MPVKLGELLLKESMITPQQLEEALAHQKMNGGKLGKAFVTLGYVKDEEITSLLSRQYGVPSINLDHFEIDPFDHQDHSRPRRAGSTRYCRCPAPARR